MTEQVHTNNLVQKVMDDKLLSIEFVMKKYNELIAKHNSKMLPSSKKKDELKEDTFRRIRNNTRQISLPEIIVFAEVLEIPEITDLIVNYNK